MTTIKALPAPQQVAIKTVEKVRNVVEYDPQPQVVNHQNT